MFKPEEIKARLEKFKNLEPWVDARLARLEDLSPSAREIGLQLLGRDRNGRGTNERLPRLHFFQHSKRLRELAENDLLKLGESLFPRFSEVIRHAWDMHARLPVQSGHGRKPFRAPGRPELILDARRQFIFGLLNCLHGYEQDLPWIAVHAAYLGQFFGAQELGILLAGAIDLGGERAREIEQILRDSAAGLHEIGQFGRHVTTAMLCSSKADNWEFIEKMLLAAQRQEGLRQSILESVDFSHPGAFRHMLRVIRENNLTRFSATVRAADVWFGLQFDSVSAKYIDDVLNQVASYLDDLAVRQLVLAGDDAQKAFFALWSIAFEDGPAAIAPAVELFRHAKAETRFIALHFLHMLGLPETYELVLKAVDDPDDRVAQYAVAIASQILQWRMHEQRLPERVAVSGIAALRRRVNIPPKNSADLFDRIERLHARIPQKAKNLKPLVWPWLKVKCDRESTSDAMVLALGERSPARLLPYLCEMSPEKRRWSAQLLGQQSPMTESVRQSLLQLVGDKAGAVREAAVNAMRSLTVSVGEMPFLESLLGRKASDLRRGVLGLILSAGDGAALASSERLTGSKDVAQRLAGLDLLVQLKDAGRAVDGVKLVGQSYKSAHPHLDRDEEVYLDKILGNGNCVSSLDDALGLMDPGKRTAPTPPQKRDVRLSSPAAIQLLHALDGLIHDRREEVITIANYSGESQQVPLGGIVRGFPSVFPPYRSPRRRTRSDQEWRRPTSDLPLAEVWFGWWQNRPAAMRDSDNLEAVRASYVVSAQSGSMLGEAAWHTPAMVELLGHEPVKFRYPTIMDHVLEWIVVHEAQPNLGDFVVDGLEAAMSAIPIDKLAARSEHGDHEFRAFRRRSHKLSTLATVARHQGFWTQEHARRLFGLRRWQDEPGQSRVERDRPDWDTEMVPAFDAGYANEHDIYDALLGPPIVRRFYAHSFNALARASTELRLGNLSPRLAQLVQRAIDRIVDVELSRGETETTATPAALALKYAGASKELIRVLLAIGRDPNLQRHHTWGESSKGKSVVFSHLIRTTFPEANESPETFSRAVESARIDEDALLAVAFYAPQWVRFIQAAVKWNCLEDAVWWIHGHTKDTSWRVDRETREGWNAEIRKFTPLTLEDLMDGAVDVDWFGRTFNAIGPAKWKRLNGFAKYASGGAGHKRAQLFADAMLGKTKRAQLEKEITTKRKQDAVRALGLLPLEKKNPKADVLKRYEVIQEFIRTSRQFGSQRQASEKLAARIGQENLSRTAGYPDPVRLQWAMEGLANADLAARPVLATVKDVSVTLSINSDGLPELTTTRGGRELKTMPPALKKSPKVEEIIERKTALRRSASRMRQSLELAMCRGDHFTGDELQGLMENVVLAPNIERLVFVGDRITGYPASRGKRLRDFSGKLEPINKAELLRLAHPVDFLRLGNWMQWQRDCFSAERIQPFKQVFRELYLLTEQEKGDGTFSRRYAGQQVNPKQAMALLGARGWVTAPQAGVFRIFHDANIVAWIEFMEPFFTPAEVEGLTLEKIRFGRRGDHQYTKLVEIPPRLFSEVMRDVDLIVSVAHRGAVDPEASASTVELRATLLRETLGLLNLRNVRIKGPHVHISGSLADYSVHLGSATTHMLPGGTLFIVPVQSQHRGRIFLPFADDDPKTAEIISKVMLLARDQELKDPSLLNQIQSRSV